MKRKNVADTLSYLRMSVTVEDKMIQLLLGIYELMIAIADRLDVFEEDEREDGEDG